MTSGFRLLPRALSLLAQTSIASALLISAHAQLPAPASDKLDLRFANDGEG